MTRQHSPLQHLRRQPLGWLLLMLLLTVLKGAVPMLATASAHVQGKTLVEVCTVYGVTLVALDNADNSQAPDHDSSHNTAHAGEHCALGGLVALGGATLLPGVWPTLQHGQAPPLPVPSASLPPDAAARWAALQQHGPPAFA